MEPKKHIWRYGFAIILVIIGIVLMYMQAGNNFLGFSSVGTWLIYVGFVMLAVVTLQMIANKKRIVDERMQFVAYKAARITFVAIILGAFIVMIADGIKPITLPYSYFMAYFVCAIVFAYVLAYKILIRLN